MNRDDSIEPTSDIAIIGFAARVPGAEDAAQFWKNLRHGVESIRAFTVAELESAGVKKSVLQDPNYVRAGAPLSRLDAFDANFFGISPRDAAIMDPQQRVFLETAWEALEHSGYAPGTTPDRTGVFAGSGPNSYLIQNLLSDPDLVEKDGIFLLRHTGNDKDVLATRVSYQMNLRGPSIAVQTACSTSLVAVHMARQSLLHYDCDMALAGAVSFEIPHAIGYHYRQNEIQSQDGHCRAFDASATGTVFGSGVGVVILRRLADAIEAGDTIHAVIKGSAVNNDGNRKVGFLAPSVEGQIEVIEEALAAADIDPATVDYVETHGTGTPIGDPIELSALDRAYGARSRPLRIGSVKTNIGHLDTAAGMAGLIKTVLALGHGQIPPTLHFKALNPLLDAKRTKVQVVDQLADWERTETPRRAGVTSLGIGGTNAHVILEEAPEPAARDVVRPVQLITLSARTPEALEDATQALASHLRQTAPDALADAAYTLHVGRAEFAHRRMFVARDRDEAIRLASQPKAHGVVSGKKSDPATVVFLFSGQGSQYVNMGLELYRTEPVFRRWLDYCAEQSQPHLGYDFRKLLYPAESEAAHAAKQIKLTWNAQPMLFAVEYALAQLWISWGVLPDKLIGHSLGEYTAACLSGVFSLEDAIALVCGRGNLMKKVAEGAMLAIARSETEVAKRLNGNLSLAAVNSHEQCVVSGPRDEIIALQEKLKKEEIGSHQLETSHAFHSGSIDAVLPAFTELVRKTKLNSPQIPVVANVTGTWLTDAEATDPAYWARHFRHTVRFADGLAALQSDPGSYMIEIGPGETLSALSRQYAGKEARLRIFPSLPRRSEKSGDLSTILAALGSMWVHGAAIDWAGFHAHEKLRRVPLPTYPFQRKRFWMGPKIGTNWLTDSVAKVDDWFYRPTWKATVVAAPPAPTGTWLLLGDSSPEFTQLAAELRAQKANVITITAGDKLEATSELSYMMNPASEQDYGMLLDRLDARGAIPRRIVHLWGLEAARATEDRCFHSLIHLLQAWGGRHPEQPLTLIACSHGSISVQQEPVTHPYGSLLEGTCRVAPLEYPMLRSRHVDVDTLEPKALAEIVLREGGAENGDAAVTLAAYRSGQRWVQDVERFHPEPAPARLRDRGVYLITGGLGGLGMAVADSLARSHRARLVLVSRHADKLDPDTEARFAEWRQLGAEVLVTAADVTDRASVARALALARDKFGPVQGIVHAAGVLQDGIIQLKKKAVAHSVLAPKLKGVQILDELTRGQPFDFFALFSSVSAIAPPDGQVDYCAANSFLNAFAQSRPADRHFLVIAWGPWAEIGMVAPKPEPAREQVPFSHPLLERVELDTATRTVYSGALSVEHHWVLAEHKFHGGDSLLPGTAHLEIAVTALWKKVGRQPITLENIVFLAPLRVAPSKPTTVYAELQKTKAGFQFSVTADDVLYVSGQCRPTPSRVPQIDLKEIATRCPDERRDSPKNIRQRGHFDFGPRWQSLRQISFGRDECLGVVEIPTEYRSDFPEFSLHPALMDIATGTAMYLVPGYERAGDLLLPFAYKRLTLYTVLPPRVFSHVRQRHDGSSDLLLFDITITSETGDVIAEIEEFTVKRLRSVADVFAIEASPKPVVALPGADSAKPLTGIPTREGLEAFQRIMSSQVPDVIYVSPTPLSLAITAKESDTGGSSINASSDDVELVLTQLWERLLGLEHVDADTDFFDSGGHSLLAVRLFTEIRKRFNIDFGLSTLFEARTIGSLAALIRKTRHSNGEKNGLAHALVPIRSGGSNTPLFLIHDVGGSVLRYEHLARHFPDNQSIYAIESRGLSGLPTDYSVEVMARHYIEQIRERQPRGPYYVAGHSFGGMVAYEIARQLKAQGETMGLVGLLDTYQQNITLEDAMKTTQAPVRIDKLPFFQRLTKDIRMLIMGHDRIGYLRERKTFIQAWVTKSLYRTAYKLSTRWHVSMPRFLSDVKEANWIALDYFTPGAYDGTVVLFRCLNRLDTDPPDSSHVWQRLTKEVVILGVPGDHNSMLREPGVAVLAKQMLSFLQAGQMKPAESKAVA